MHLIRKFRLSKWHVKALVLLGLALLVPVLFFGFLFVTSWVKWDREKSDLVRNVDAYYRHMVQVESRLTSLALTSVPTRIYDRSGNLIGEFSPEKRELVPGRRIPKLLKQAILAMEDTDFFHHNGINIKRIFSALIENLTGGRTVGGSTITQQLAKLLFTNRERSLERKMFEFFGAKELESRFSKNDILLMYLNTVYFGHAAYGVQAAARLYFQKPVELLDPYECALLAGLIPRPEAYSPINNIDQAKRKHIQTLNRMVALGFVRSSVLNEGFEKFWADLEQKLKSPSVSYWNMTKNEAPYFIEFVRQRLQQYFKDDEIIRGGLEVHTTLDLALQKNAEKAVINGLVRVEDAKEKYIARWLKTEQSRFEQRYKRLTDAKKRDEALQAWTRQRKAYLEERQKPIEAALVGMDANNGYVLSMVGGRNYTFDNQLNRAVFSKRQFGSAMKPVIYATALENKTITASTIIPDRRRDYLDHGRHWSPKNYGGIYFGDITVRRALAMSANTVAVETIHRLGPDKVAAKLERVFFNKRGFPPILSLPLGSVELSTIDAARIYCAFASGGYRVKPLFIRSIVRVTHEDGAVKRTTLYNFEDSQPVVPPISGGGDSLPDTLTFDNDNALGKSDSSLVFDPRAVYITTQMMRDVLSPRGTAGYARAVTGFSLNAAGKSGTSDNLRDAWFCGFVKRTVAAVWVGYDSDKTPLPEDMTGGSAAGPIWADYMHRSFWNSDQYAFPRPDGVTTQLICRDSGLLATSACTNTFSEFFIAGTEPVENCQLPHGSASTNSVFSNQSQPGTGGRVTNRVRIATN